MLCLLQWASIEQQWKKWKNISTTYIDFYNNCQTLYSAYKISCLPWFDFQVYVMRMCFNQASGSWWKSHATLLHTSQLIFAINDSLNYCSNQRINFFQKPTFHHPYQDWLQLNNMVFHTTEKNLVLHLNLKITEQPSHGISY